MRMLLFLLLTQIVTAQETLLVKVENQLGFPVSGAIVKAKHASCTTDAEGKCSLNLDKNESFLTVQAEGFAEELVRIQHAKEVKVVLKPIVAYVSVISSYLAGKDDALLPGSFQIISKEEFEESRYFTPSEALRRITGVHTREEEGFGLRPNISIRGTNPTRSTKILLLEDGVPLTYAPYGDNASYYHPPIERFEAVEVLKGSGQIAYGPVTVAGVINYITPNPPEKRQFSLKLLGGNRDIFDGSLSYGESFGRLGLISAFTRKQGKGARDNVRIGLNDFSSKFNYQLNTKNYLTFKFSHLKEDSRVTYSGLTEAEYNSNPRQNPFRNDSFNAFRTGFSLQYTSLLNNFASLNATSYINYFSRDWWRQSSNSNERPNRLGSDPDCRGMQDLYTTCGNQGRLRDYLTWGVEPRLNLTFNSRKDIRNELNLGFRIHSEKQDRLQKNGDLPLSRDGTVVENNLRENFALSGFVQYRLIWKNLTFVPGLRLENIKYKRTNRLNGASGKTQITEIIPGFGITANLFGNTTIFAGVHRGFAPPRTEDIISNNGGVIDLESEKSWNYEIGLRSLFLRALKMEITFFRTDYENQIVPASVAGGIGATFTNAGKTLHQGIELFTRFDSNNVFNTSFNFYLQIAHTELEKAEFRGRRFSSINPNILVTRNRLPYAPRRLSDIVLGFAYKNLDWFVEGNYISKQFADDLNRINPTPNGQQGIIPAQTYVNMTLNYRIESWKTVLFFTTKNLLDKTFIVDRSRGILPSMPRLLQAGLKLTF
ncbi:MAG: TonB-dependent receptor [Pyrinomonadaceae bacterium]|nr:TonB-dependent receptor [Pyrinomonadaceae bacterium]MCX7640196.1 TonB-dependent receptor [Pyrinomonadaceae bacterium]MDW8303216.1 TonB-dependent receptor [Acidobacteriota bacterium]